MYCSESTIEDKHDLKPILTHLDFMSWKLQLVDLLLTFKYMNICKQKGCTIYQDVMF